MNVEWMINVIDQIIAGFPKKVRITAGFFLRKPGRDEFLFCSPGFLIKYRIIFVLAMPDIKKARCG
jgi:hypothetical protein